MPDRFQPGPDRLESGLAGLAEHGRRTGRLDPAAAIRARADRRRKRRYAATGALGVALVAALGAGIAVAQPSPKDPAPPAGSSVPSASGPAKAGGVLSGSRQVYFSVVDQGVELPESNLAVSAGGRLEVADEYGDTALFVPTPAQAGSGDFLIKTGKLRSGGAALCLQVKTNGSNPLTVVDATCDPADDSQLFKIQKHGKDSNNDTTYAIENRGTYLQWNPTGSAGLIAEELGDATLETTFVITDRGASTVPN